MKRLIAVTLVGLAVWMVLGPYSKEGATLNPVASPEFNAPALPSAPARLRRDNVTWRHPELLARALATAGKALPSAEERRELAEILANPDFLNGLTESLMNAASQTLSRETERSHLAQLDLFIKSLDPKQNPQWEDALGKANQLLTQSAWRLKGPLAARRLLAGDCVEIFQAIKRLHSARAQEILAQADEKTRLLLSYGVPNRQS